MASKPLERGVTYDDLLRVPSHLVAEIIDGELVTHPRPTARHALAASNLGVQLGGDFGRRGGNGPGGWVLLDEPELHLGEQVLVPDLAGWRRERMPDVPDVAYFELVPDWVCEVVSPATARYDRTRKADHYATSGVAHLWLLDPGPRTLEVFRLDGARWLRVASFAGEHSVRAEPFDAAELDLGELWDVPR